MSGTKGPNPSKNIRQNVYGGTESVVAPVGSEAAWQAILRVRREMNPTHYHDRPVRIVAPPRVVESKVTPCIRCGQLVRKPEAGARDYCPECSVLMARITAAESRVRCQERREIAREVERLRGAA